MKTSIASFAVALLCACASAESVPVSSAPAGDAAESYAMASTGSWTSRDQSTDSRYDWVESETVRIMTDRADGIWLYQENAIMGAGPDVAVDPAAKGRPYFQVVIQLRAMSATDVHTTTYRLDAPEARAGAKGLWRDPDRGFDPAWVGPVACMGQMSRVADGFWQGGVDCPNTYKGGAKVDSRSIRTPDTYVNWDRGFDITGSHVWGPATGGYVFKRKEGAP